MKHVSTLEAAVRPIISTHREEKDGLVHRLTTNLGIPAIESIHRDGDLKVLYPMCLTVVRMAFIGLP
jgi:hypothetical protein